jgi:hypothetical protein
MADKNTAVDLEDGVALPAGQGTLEVDDPGKSAKRTPLEMVTAGDPNAETGDVLDDLLVETAKTPEELEAERVAAEEEAVKKQAAAESPEQKAEREKKEAEVAAADAKKKGADAAAAAKKDVLDDVKLPPHARAKSGEAFETVKRLAREQLAAKEAKIAELEKEKQELSEKAKAPIPAELTTELEDLRKWRKHSEIDKAPEFAEFDAKASKAHEAVYAKLTEHGATPEQIAKIKEYGGPDKVDLDPFLEPLPGVARRYIETRLIEAETQMDLKKEAITTAKKDAEKFFAERAGKQDASTKSEILVERKAVEQFLALPELAWMKEPVLAADATEEQKKEAAAQKDFIKAARDRIENLHKTRTPEARAELIVGTQLAYFFKAQLTDRQAKLDAAQKELKEKTEELDKIKKASGARQRPSSAPARSGASSTPHRIGVRAEQALDDLLAEHRAAAA